MVKALFKIHRVLGTVLSLFFFLWFSSGFVMLFRSFPSVSEADVLRGLAPLAPAIADTLSRAELGEAWSKLPEQLQSVELKALPTGQGFVLGYRAGEEKQELRSDGKTGYSLAELEQSAGRYLGSEVVRIDSVASPDTWVPYDRPGRFPAYRFYYDDAQRSELYLSTTTGEAVQATDRSSRLWAYLGAIPHWIYPYQLRQYRDAWVWVISIISGLGVVMCLVGIIIGLRISWLSCRRRGDLASPYKRYAYRWHHYLGLVFGLFTTVFIFSGFMSVQRIPDWLVRKHSDKTELASQLHIQRGELSLPTVLDKAPLQGGLGDIKRISWQGFGTLPYVRVSGTESSKCYRIPLEGEELQELELSEGEIFAFVESLCPGRDFRMELMTSYDNYYIDRHGELPLPVYKVEVEDEDRTSFYIDAKTAKWRTHSRNSRLLRTLYGGLHSWVFAPLVAAPWLWWVFIFAILIGGWLLSGTSLVLSVAYLRKAFKPKGK